jgi:hypothetical protein
VQIPPELRISEGIPSFPCTIGSIPEGKDLKPRIDPVFDVAGEERPRRRIGYSKVHPEPRFRQECHQLIQSLRLVDERAIVHNQVPHLSQSVGAIEQYIDFCPLNVEP